MISIIKFAVSIWFATTLISSCKKQSIREYGVNAINAPSIEYRVFFLNQGWSSTSRGYEMNLSCANLTQEVIQDHLFYVYLTIDQLGDNFTKMPFTQSYPPPGTTIYADYEVMPGSLRLIVTGINYQLTNLSDVMIGFK